MLLHDAHAEARPPTEAAESIDALFFDLFLRLMDVPAAQVAAEFLEAQRRLCRALDLDRSALWQTMPGVAGQLFVTHVYDRAHDGVDRMRPDGSVERGDAREFLLSGASSITLRAEASVRFPWIVRRVFEGLTTAVSDIDALPPEAAADGAALRGFGTLSTVIVPLLADDEVLGCLSFATTRARCDWPALLVTTFERLAKLFAKALARERSGQRLREGETWTELAVAAAGAGPWQFDFTTGRVRATPTALRIYGLDPEAGEVDVEEVIARLHPDDRQLLRERVRWAREHREGYVHEYRVQLPGGEVRWIHSRGRSFSSVAAESPDRMLGVSIDVTERKLAEAQLEDALSDLRRLRDQIQRENVYLRSELRARRGSASIVGTSPALQRVLAQAEQVAPTLSTVLLLGETGTGKERFAEMIHDLSPRHARPMVKVNCGAMPASLIESELFGREKGAYTGALTRQAGRFEFAHDSTIFLDEIGDLPLEIQMKLLRVIETRTFERLGSSSPIHVNVRIIAATNRDLPAAVRDGRFREDLFYRLNVFPIALPPLRERVEDIPLLVRALVDDLQQTMGRQYEQVPAADLKVLQQHRWPGNIRELRNVIERAMIAGTGPVLRIPLPALDQSADQGLAQSLRALEQEHILAVLQRTGWRIRGPHGAALALGLPPTTLENRMNRLGIKRPGRTP
jgi:PAS domain S-box-containing protein